MFNFFNRNKKEKQLDKEIRKTAEAIHLEIMEQALIDRAIETLSVESHYISDITEYCFVRSSQIVGEIFKSYGKDIKQANDDDILTAGLFLFVVSNHISYKLDTSFEQVSTMSVIDFLKDIKSAKEAANYVNPIADLYNKSAIDSKITLAIGQNLIKWLERPDQANFEKLVALYEICRENIK